MRLLFIHLHNSPRNQQRTSIVLGVFCLFARQSDNSLAFQSRNASFCVWRKPTVGTDLPQDLWAELQHALECFELCCLLTKQPVSLQHFCPCLCCLLTLKRWAKGENNPSGKLMAKGKATMGGEGVSVQPCSKKMKAVAF